MRFSVLGALELRDPTGRPVRLTSRKLQLLLAFMLCHRNTRVSVDTLIDTLWEERPPPSARSNLHGYVLRLRRLLGHPQVIRHGDGYELVVEPGDADDELFSRLAEEGRQELVAGNPAAAAKLLTSALSLWRAPNAYADIAEADPDLALEAARLDELRQVTLENRIDADLALGEHDQLVPELMTLTTLYPLRQQLHAQLILAQHRAGRTADALESYRRVRALMVDQLGLEPSHELRELERAILNGDHTVDPLSAPPQPGTATATVPAELPAADPTFSGRRAELSQLVTLLTTDTGRRRIVAIDGPGGIGKSSLAIQVAHAIRQHFPDGQLYVNLRGATPGVEPLDPQAAIHRLLRVLGADDAMDDVGEEVSTAAYRTALADRRLLILLDDARDAEQVHQLLPPSHSQSAVIVTSRSRLTDLGQAEHMVLDSLPVDDAITLLVQLAGEERVNADPRAAADIVRLCGQLPLAVRIAGVRLVARPDWSLEALCQRLASAQGRLDELEHDDLAVRASYDVAHDALSTEAATVFTHLGLVDLHDFTVPTVAALTGWPRLDVYRLMLELAEAHLVTSRSERRYGLHAIVRLYARERAAEMFDATARAAAVRRLLHHYLASARAAASGGVSWSPQRSSIGPADHELLHPGLALADGPAIAGWIRGEADNIAVATQAASDLPGEGTALLAGLAAALYHPLRGQGEFYRIVALNRLVLNAATTSAAWQARAHLDLAEIYTLLNSFVDASEHGLAALRLFRDAGDTYGEGEALSVLGATFRQANQLDDAIDHCRRSLKVHEATGDRKATALALTNLGSTYLLAGRVDAAVDTHLKALDTSADVQLRGVVLFRLGEAYRAAGRSSDALRCFAEAAEIFRAGGVSQDEALALWLRGDLLATIGQGGEARVSWRRSVDVLLQMGLVERAEARRLRRAPIPQMPEPLRRGRPITPLLR
ncbi:AfsR/SARP family transcriptional regulator [Phytoactinopolyspora limicola]|uniref:AfsR/SARP family transcriptional regulator n=1 Tax=Phytoactinopolyspora limicola TaxID=2715536 RepID=UPI00140C334C|nr:AfsR/SARP family transcriptional regulator [Phytoactinopolyspora limicola]